MRMRQARWIFVLGLGLLAGTAAHASATPATYTFTCGATAGKGINLTLNSFTLQTSVTPNTTGSAAGSKPAYAATIHFLSNDFYSILQTDLIDGVMLSSCPLTERVVLNSSSTGTDIYEWTFKNILFTSVTAIGSDASNTSSGGTDVQTGYMQATFNFNQVSFTYTIEGPAT